MKQHTIPTAISFVFLASAAVHAQQAVQWKVSDGGNGNWYQVDLTPLWWDAWNDRSAQLGGALASVTSQAEQSFVVSIIDPMAQGGYPQLLWLGATRRNCQWRWTTGEAWGFTSWSVDNPNGACIDAQLGIFVNQIATQYNLGWDDCVCPSNGEPTGAILEWSADCNSDGIVDYGQCHDGSMPDHNGNNIPDCCEQGVQCTVGDFPVQWRVEDGGNGHWYQLVFEGHPSWTQAKLIAEQRGGYLATLTSQGENDLAGRLSRGLSAMLLGGFQDHSSPNYSEPAGGWRWITDEPWTFTNWGAGEPDNASNGHGEPGEDYLYSWTGAQGFKWGDGDNICPECNPGPFLVEWSADCNSDGVVDYGQILQGQLIDANTNGIPDVCEGPTCHDADLFRDLNVNGADLGIMLSQWGPNTPLTESDLNNDGAVNGADLGLLLYFWGACP